MADRRLELADRFDPLLRAVLREPRGFEPVLYSPVRWVETVLAFGKLDITHNVECAPGRILAGLNKRIDTQQVSLAMNDAAALTQALLIFA